MFKPIAGWRQFKLTSTLRRLFFLICSYYKGLIEMFAPENSGVRNVCFRKTWRALFSCYLRFEICLFVLLPSIFWIVIILLSFIIYQNRLCRRSKLKPQTCNRLWGKNSAQQHAGTCRTWTSAKSTLRRFLIKLRSSDHLYLLGTFIPLLYFTCY